MSQFIQRVGTTYIPVSNVQASSLWYQKNLGARENYRDEEKAILDFANQSFFLVKALTGETSNFKNRNGNDHFSLTFEVDGYNQLTEFHSFLKANHVKVSDIEDRGHRGNNFVFYDLDDNMFDVWSELSPSFRTSHK